jgi:hypothetical protein
MRTRFKAILTALAVVVAWCAVPIIAASLLDGFRFPGSDLRKCLQGLVLILCPLAVPAGNELGLLHSFPPFNSSPFSEWKTHGFNLAPQVIAVNFTLYAAMLFFFRHLALSRADRYLRR